MMFAVSFQDPSLVQPYKPTYVPKVLANVPLNGAQGRCKLHTVVPLPIYDSSAPIVQELFLMVDGKPLQTQRRPITRHGGRVSSVELVAVGDVPHGVDMMQVAYIEMGAQLESNLSKQMTHPDLANFMASQVAMEVHYKHTDTDSLSTTLDFAMFTPEQFGDDDRAKGGPVYTEFEFNETLAGAPIRCWFRIYRHIPLVEFDFDWVNGDSSKPVGDILFSSLRLRYAGGYRGISLTPARCYYNDSSESVGGSFVFANADLDLGQGGMHCLLMHRQYHARLALAPTLQIEHAEKAAKMVGWGVCNSNGQGYDFFSLNSPVYNPHLTPLPKLVSSRQALKEKWADRWLQYSDNLRHGTPMQSELSGHWEPELGGGFYRPWGPSYGGVTGGLGLGMRSNVEAVVAGTNDVVRQLMLEHWADSTTRPEMAVVRGNGQPFDPREAGNGRVHFNPGAEAWVPDRAPGVTQDWAGLESYRSAERRAVLTAACPYAAVLMQRGAQDSQHGGRYIQDAAALGMLVGDRIAIRHMQQRAVTSWFEKRDKYDLSEAVSHQGKGYDVGRDDGWALRTVAEACRFVGMLDYSPDILIGMVQWSEDAADFIAKIQMPTGLLMRNHYTKYAKELQQAAGAQQPPGVNAPWQDGIVADGLYALTMAVLQHRKDPDRVHAALQTIIGVARGTRWAWKGQGSHWDVIAVAPAESGPLYSDQIEIPSSYKRGATNFYLPPLIVDAAWAAIRTRSEQSLDMVIELIFDYLNDKPLSYAASTGFSDERNMKAPLIWLAENFTEASLLALASKPETI